MEQASKFFKCSLESDKKYAIAHYNYASTLAPFHEKAAYDPCDYTYLNEIQQHLQVSIQLDPKRRDRMKKDPDFDSIRDLDFYKLLTISPNASIRKILLEIGTWHGPVPGVFPTSMITFHNNGSATLRIFNLEGENGPENFDWSSKIKGRFSINKNSIQVIFSNPKVKNLKGTLKTIYKKKILTGVTLEFDKFYNHTPDSGSCSS